MIVFILRRNRREEGGGPACCGPPANRCRWIRFVELIFARRVVAMGEVDLLMQGGTDSTPFPALQIPQMWDGEYWPG